jgi:hypothetical protein
MKNVYLVARVCHEANRACTAWNTRAVDPAAIREAALREAASVAWTYGHETQDDVQQRILALIGEKK